jgi:putative Holliday junction resolvase
VARILAVDPGDVRIGLALSDPAGILATPLRIVEHTKRWADAAEIVQEALAHEVERIVVGIALDDEGRRGHQARKCARLAQAIQEQTDVPVTMWDESGTSVRARASGGQRHRLDARAAAVLLQEYLDAQTST